MSVVRALRRTATFNPRAIGGGNVRVIVKNRLLNPLRGEIAGILHIGDQKVFLPKDGIITIGRARKCDIRILDPSIDPQHILITHMGENDIRVNNFSQREIMIKNEAGKTEKLAADPNNIEGVPLLNDNSIIFGLTGIDGKGNGRFLEMKIEYPKEITEDLCLALAFETKPPIEEVSPEAAKVRIEQQRTASAFIQSRGLTVAQPIDPALVEGTIFSEARTTSELFNLYFHELKKITRTFKRRDRRGIIAMMVGAFLPIVTTATITSWQYFIPSYIISGILFFSGIAEAAISFRLYNRFNESFANILSMLDANEITRLLAERTPNGREHVLRILDEHDSVKATAVRNRLAEIMEAPQLRVEAPETESTAPRIDTAEFEAEAEAQAMAEAEAAEAEADREEER